MTDQGTKRHVPELRWPVLARTPGSELEGESNPGNTDAAAARERVWQNVEARLARDTSTSSAPGEPARQQSVFGHRVFWFGLSAAAASAFSVWGVLSPAVQIGAENVAELRTLDQRPFDELRVPVSGPSARVALAGGVEISASAGTELKTLAATERDVVLQLQRGAARFSVPPNGGRHWVIEAGLATVDVVGTVFEVKREAHRVSVDVSRGVVLVRSAHLPDGVARVNAGSSLNIDEPEFVQAAPTDTDALPAVGTARHTSERAPTSTTPRASDLPSSEAREQPQSPQTADDLLARADAARLAGNLNEAEEYLKQMVTHHPSDPRRALAMFTLGVVQSQGHKPATLVAVSFRRALSLTTTASLREDCFQRLIEAELESGQRDSAEQHLAQYKTEFPQGRHRERLQRLLTSSEPSRDAP